MHFRDKGYALLVAIAVVLAVAATRRVGAVEHVEGPKRIACPQAAAGCEGHCDFKIVTSYDVSPVDSTVSNLKLRFDHSCQSERCTGSFDGGRGFLRYVTEDDRSFVFTVDGLRTEEEVRRQTLSPADQAELTRIETKGPCHTWTQAEVDWWRGHAVPTTLNGWQLRWECQQAEVGRGGMSITDVDADPAARIKRFQIVFDIQIHTACGGRRNRDLMQVRLEGP